MSRDSYIFLIIVRSGITVPSFIIAGLSDRFKRGGWGGFGGGGHRWRGPSMSRPEKAHPE